MCGEDEKEKKRKGKERKGKRSERKGKEKGEGEEENITWDQTAPLLGGVGWEKVKCNRLRGFDGASSSVIVLRLFACFHCYCSRGERKC
ncbi:hypothetical protein TIFTF001_011408 [Ficus carica]|uniref:Uncharacterized protein n=1 Tax=Ficus carica TaxID=3494 RepID=A0AA87ZRN5_FICCA|nr:hypothetical protein TIFTF001_011408 [Ficus carica]